MGIFNLDGRKPIYTTPDGKIQFVPNYCDGPRAYDVLIADTDHLYIPDRTLGDLTNPGVSTERMMQSLETMCAGQVTLVLEDNELTPEQLHIGLLQLRVLEQERELNTRPEDESS